MDAFEFDARMSTAVEMIAKTGAVLRTFSGFQPDWAIGWDPKQIINDLTVHVWLSADGENGWDGDLADLLQAVQDVLLDAQNNGSKASINDLLDLLRP